MKVLRLKLIVCLIGLASLLPLSAQAGIVQDQQAQIDDLIERVELLEALLENVSRDGTEMYFDNVNINIRNGLGATNGDPGMTGVYATNGTGNLVIGYNEEQLPVSDKSGSHNLVVGPEHNYSSYGGIVGGFGNTISGANATVSGGGRNEASGPRSSVCGGGANLASGPSSSVSGGRAGIASGFNASVSGGDQNEAAGNESSVTGGWKNFADGADATVSGGYYNDATGQGSSVSGGQYNVSSSYVSSVSGGQENTARGQASSVSGGQLREATSNWDWVAGSLFEDF